jgi:hypothetical protein
MVCTGNSGISQVLCNANTYRSINVRLFFNSSPVLDLKYPLRLPRLSRACIIHLVIKRTNWSYVKTTSCTGSHLGISINIKNTKFVKDLPMIMQFMFNQCNSFREENISVFSQ